MSGTTIWKYPLRITDYQIVDMPEGAQLLCVQNQRTLERNTVCLWAIVPDDVNAPKEPRHFEVIGTGNPMPATTEQRHYIGTAVMGPLVWHVFELR